MEGKHSGGIPSATNHGWVINNKGEKTVPMRPGAPGGIHIYEIEGLLLPSFLKNMLRSKPPWPGWRVAEQPGFKTRICISWPDALGNLSSVPGFLPPPR